MAAGLSAGLFGVGGGLVIVPALVVCFSALSVSESVLMPLAIGTSLATIVVTSMSSVRAHHKLGNVDWRVWMALTPGIVLGVVFGVNTVAALPAATLKLAFGIFAVAVAIQMAAQLSPPASRVLPGRTALSVAGLVIGYVSALFGIGGGSLTVPFLSFCNVRMQRAVATAAACGLPIAVAGMVSNILLGVGDTRLPAYSTGFVYWPAFIGIVVFSVPFAKLGAGLAQRLSSLVLKRIFSGFLFIVGIFFFWGA
jgi:uncharacterized membrane protein YfcA